MYISFKNKTINPRVNATLMLLIQIPDYGNLCSCTHVHAHLLIQPLHCKRNIQLPPRPSNTCTRTITTCDTHDTISKRMRTNLNSLEVYVFCLQTLKQSVCENPCTIGSNNFGCRTSRCVFSVADSDTGVF